MRGRYSRSFGIGAHCVAALWRVKSLPRHRGDRTETAGAFASPRTSSPSGNCVRAFIRLQHITTAAHSAGDLRRVRFQRVRARASRTQLGRQRHGANDGGSNKQAVQLALKIRYSTVAPPDGPPLQHDGCAAKYSFTVTTSAALLARSLLTDLRHITRFLRLVSALKIPFPTPI